MSGVGAIAGSGGCAMPVIAYAPGTFALTGSPFPDELNRMYWAGFGGHAVVEPAASARRGSARMDIGMPVASERSPSMPPPKSVLIRNSRREAYVAIDGAL